MSVEPFYGDPDKIAAAWRALSIGEAERGANYRRWADEASNETERAHWTAEAEKQECGSRWHAEKARQWAEGANG